MDKIKGEGGGFGWGGVEGWGENADNCNWATVKKCLIKKRHNRSFKSITWNYEANA